MKWLILLVPVSLLLAYVVHASPTWVFAASVLAIVPLADWIRRATEQLGHRTGPAVGGLVNITFGNLTELILAIFVLLAGHVTTAKAQITGSLIGNSLLGLGLAVLVGGIGREHQRFNRRRAGLLSTLLVLVVMAIMVPAAFDYTERVLRDRSNPAWLDERLSLAVAIVLIAIYIANLIYTFVTHRDVFGSGEEGGAPEGQPWSIWLSIGVLLGATVLVAWESELVSSALESTATSLGLSPFFLGVTVLAIVGNAAEYVTAIYFARKNQMSYVMTVTVGSTIQVGLLIAPVLVLISHFMGHPMNLVFSSPLELIAIAGVAFAVNSISEDGRTTWFEGVFLLGIYAILAFAFFFVGS